MNSYPLGTRPIWSLEPFPPRIDWSGDGCEYFAKTPLIRIDYPEFRYVKYVEATNDIDFDSMEEGGERWIK